MEPITFNQQDPFFTGSGPINVVLLDPRVTTRQTAEPGAIYNPAFDQKDWAYPAGTGRVRAWQLDVFDDKPELVPYIVPEAISSVFNLVTNSNKEGIVPFLPKPLVPLTGKQAIVKVRVIAGLIVEDQWWVIQDSSLTPMADPITSPAGGSFTDADRKLLHDTYVLLMKVAQINGIK